jgi:hypothetical protein
MCAGSQDLSGRKAVRVGEGRSAAVDVVAARALLAAIFLLTPKTSSSNAGIQFLQKIVGF